ncbi:LuxR family transcriptional regulator AbaR [Kitasatospora kazusensis]|uniref:LuxR family transcriptional regulator AbaR n=1 Tax=Kitasatospora kazusensis TaxID=407974 RepID=A0ABN2Z6T6_9ACTN
MTAIISVEPSPMTNEEPVLDIRESLAVCRPTLDFHDDQDWTAQIGAIQELFALAAEKVGVRYFSYQIVRCPVMTLARPRTPGITTFPEAWQHRYAVEGYAENDPVLAECLVNPVPFSWSRLSLSPGLGQRQRQFLKEAQAAGLGQGMTIPIHAQGEVAALNLVPDEHRASLMHSNSYLLYLMAHYLHLKARRPLVEVALATSARRRSLLSPRETEALEWTARGKTTREISIGLGISEKGVEFHLEGAKRKLQASNRTHAVAKALVLRLLFANP